MPRQTRGKSQSPKRKQGSAARKVSPRKVSSRKVSSRKVSSRKVSSRKVSPRARKKATPKRASTKPKAKRARSARSQTTVTTKGRVSSTGAAKKKAAKRAAKTASSRSAASSKRNAPARAAATKRAARRQSTANAEPAEDGLAFRLDAAVRAQRYRVRIRVDPTHSKDYDGEVEIDCELAAARDYLELHAIDLQLLSASIALGARVLPARIEHHPERETVSLHVAERLPEGPLTARLAFAGELRDDLRGFYAASSGERRYAFTQLEAADARRFFPCFDEPAQKACWQLTAVIPNTLTAISNSPLEREEPDGDGYKSLHFAQTPLLSSYLVALAVGELVASEPVDAGGVPIRVLMVPGNEALTAFALDVARESLLRLSEYFALPYPYEKLDLVAVPDFEIGAMENAGAVFFRETLLLVDEQSVSLAERKRAAEVICHELAHMWYGNLVTMQFWDDLWLNEAFATWMSFDILAKWRPEWKMWNDFGHARDSALALDALANTHPVYCEVRTPAEASENFDLITYEKGAAVVRMLERYLGADTFRSGVRRYIERHRERNTVASDLWRALSEAAGRDVEAVVRPFIERPGFPLLRVTREQQPARVRLEQDRFDARGPDAQEVPSEPWPIPWVGRVGHGGTGGMGGTTSLVRELLTERSAHVALGADAASFVYGNADEGGFFRPLHDASDLPALLRALPELQASERLGFAQHQWALVRAGYTELADFLCLLPALRDERDPDVLHALLGPSEHLLEDVARAAGQGAQAALREQIERLFAPALRELGLTAAAGEDDDTRLCRAELFTLVAVIAQAPSLADAAESCCVAYLRERGAVDANLIAPVLAIGARNADAARFDAYLDASEQEPTPQARRRFRLAIADVRAPELVERALEVCLTRRIPTQDVAFVMARLLRNPYARKRSFDFMREHFPVLRERIPSMLMSRLIDATPALGGEAERKAVMQFFSEHPLPTAERALRQADERFRLDAAFRQRAKAGLVRWLAEQPTN